MIYYYILLISILILVILTVYYIVHVYNSLIFDDVNNHLYYMTKDETSLFLEYDDDAYVANLSSIDLYARKAITNSEYINFIKNSAAPFTYSDREILDKCTKIADELLRKVKIDSISKEKNLNYSKYINYKDIATIKWVISKTSAEDSEDKIYRYEEGLPHTRKNIIFLSTKVLNYSEDELIKILIHEKIHIYQRYNEKLFKNIINNMGYTEVSINDISTNTLKYIRANPDLDKKIYKNINDGNLMLCLYSSDRPNGINDVLIKDYSSEHPYEKIAYEISDYIHNMSKIEIYKQI
jgi:predicted metallopeptidase